MKVKENLCSFAHIVSDGRCLELGIDGVAELFRNAERGSYGVVRHFSLGAVAIEGLSVPVEAMQMARLGRNGDGVGVSEPNHLLGRDDDDVAGMDSVGGHHAIVGVACRLKRMDGGEGEGEAFGIGEHSGLCAEKVIALPFPLPSDSSLTAGGG